MFSRDIPSYPLDLTGQATTNKVINEFYRRTDTKLDTVFVPLSGPFYIESMVLTDPLTNTAYVEDKDYEFLGICSEITAFIKNKEVGMCVHWLNDSVTEWYATYQVVGHFSYLQRELIDLTQSVIDDDRPVWYKDLKDKPLWFPPEVHRHDVRYELHSYADLIACIKRIATLKQNQVNPITSGVSRLIDNLSDRITVWQTTLKTSLDQHISDINPHGLTAAQVELGNVENLLTANLIETINGSRHDRHITMENVDQAVRQATTPFTQLIKNGSLPLLMYGSTGFIPPSITGSFEGQGGNNFRMGFNIEPNGDALILTPRADGRVDGLYFMINTQSIDKLDQWKYTAYRYQHQTATADGVNLNRILQGANGKFLIVGGTNAAGAMKWYYTTGNGTFDPAKHILTPLPDKIISPAPHRVEHSTLTTATFPDRVMLWIPQLGSDTFNGPYKNVFYDLPAGEENGTSFPGIDTPYEGVGHLCWEYTLADKTWRQVVFTYTPAGYPNQPFTSPFYCPYRYKVVKITADNPRIDGVDHPYGLQAYEFKYNYPITCWTNRLWGYGVLDWYDEQSDVVGIKGYDSAYGYDGRPLIVDGGAASYGFLLKNRTVSTDQVHYTITNGRGLEDELYLFDVTKSGYHLVDQSIINPPHFDSYWQSFAGGAGAVAWIKPGVAYAAGSQAYGSFPLAITYMDVSEMAAYSSAENWVNSTQYSDPPPGDKRGYLQYNESNTSGFTVGAHSVFYLQLNPNDVNTYGGVSYSSSGMTFRKQSALDANGIPVKPPSTFTLYGESVTGYPLENTSYTFNGPETRPYLTNIFSNLPNNRRSEYMKQLISHSPYPDDTITFVRNETANHNVETEHEVVMSGNSFSIKATKTYDLADQLKNTLFPFMIQGAKDKGYKVVGNNLPATYHLTPANLATTVFEKLMVCAGIAFQEDAQECLVLSVCFDITGGTNTNGLVTGAKITPVGNVFVTPRWTMTDDVYERYQTENTWFERYLGVTITKCRDLSRQMDNGRSFVWLNFEQYVAIKGNISMMGLATVVGEDGIEAAWGLEPYYIAGEYQNFIHPYYGVVNRVRPPASSQIGNPYRRDVWAYGDFQIDYSLQVLGHSNYLQSAYTIYIGTDQQVEVNGTPYTLKATSIDLRTIDIDPSNSTYYLYLVYGTNGPEYSIVSNALPETASRALLSVIKTNKDSIYEIENYNVFSMNGFRISATRHGSVIPSATGSIDAPGQADGWVDS